MCSLHHKTCQWQIFCSKKQFKYSLKYFFCHKNPDYLTLCWKPHSDKTIGLKCVRTCEFLKLHFFFCHKQNWRSCEVLWCKPNSDTIFFYIWHLNLLMGLFKLYIFFFCRKTFDSLVKLVQTALQNDNLFFFPYESFKCESTI